MKGKETKAERLYAAHYKAMFAEALSILRNADEAEDAVSESFVKIINNIERIEENSSEKTRAFLVIICRNTAKDMCKTKIRVNYNEDLAESLKSEASPEKIVISNETAEQIVGIIGRLDPMYTDVLLLKNVYKFSREEIAAMLNISVETVKKRPQRAKSKIAAERAAVNFGKNAPEAIGVIPSEKHIKKMNAIFAKERKKQRRQTRMKRLKTAAAVAAAVCVVCGTTMFGVEAFRVKVMNFIYDREAPNSDIFFSDEIIETYTDKNVTLGYIPEGFHAERQTGKKIIGTLFLKARIDIFMYRQIRLTEE